MSGENLQELIYQLQTELVALERRLTSIIRRSGFYRLQGAAPDASINFQTGTGGGIEKIDKTGIATKTSTGGNGVSHSYDPAKNIFLIGKLKADALMIKSSTYTSVLDENGTEIARVYKFSNGFKILAANLFNWGFGSDEGIGTRIGNLNDGPYQTINASGSYLSSGINSSPYYEAINSAKCIYGIAQKNNTGSNSIIGYRYKIPDANGFVVSPTTDTVNTLGLLVCDSIATNGAYARVIMLANADGQRIHANFSTTTTAGHYAVFDSTNAGQFADSATPVSGKTIGIILETIATPGLALIMIQKQ